MAEPVTPVPPQPDEKNATSPAPVPPANGAQQSENTSPLRRLFTKVIDIGLWVLVLGVVGLALMPSRSGPGVGKPAEAVEVRGVDGARARQHLPGELKKPLLIEAFASWCGACRRNARILDDLALAREEGRLDVIAVSVDDSPAQALLAKNAWPISVPVLHDSNGEFSSKYKVEVLPTYILVGTDGQVKRVTSGNPGASDIRAWLREYEESTAR